MRAVICGANGAMGKLIGGILGEEVVGRVSIDGENGVAKTFAELGNDIKNKISHRARAVSKLAEYLTQTLP